MMGRLTLAVGMRELRAIHMFYVPGEICKMKDGGYDEGKKS